MKWITRQRPKIDRIACPWLIARFIDREPEFVFATPSRVLAEAGRLGAIPFDVPGVELGHEGALCSFDAFLRKYRLADAALRRLAAIVRAADTGTASQSPQAHGLLAISLGLNANIADDQALLRSGFVIYDALHTWCRMTSGDAGGRTALPPPMSPLVQFR